MATESQVYVGTDGTITMTGLVIEPAGTPVTGATVTGTLFDGAGNSITNWISMTLSDQGGGTYSADYQAANVPSPGVYNFKVVAVKTGTTLTFFHRVEAAQSVTSVEALI